MAGSNPKTLAYSDRGEAEQDLLNTGSVGVSTVGNLTYFDRGEAFINPWQGPPAQGVHVRSFSVIVG